MALVKPAAERRAMMVRLADEHGKWVAGQPVPTGHGSGDHNQHATDIDTTPESESDFQARARAVLGR